MKDQLYTATRSEWRRLIGLVALIASVLGWDPPLGESHARLDRSEPAAGVSIVADRLPRGISLWFTQPVKVVPNAVAVLDSAGRRVDRLDAGIASDDRKRIDVALGELAPGAYSVRWKVTSVDNHVIRGSFWFVAGFAATPPPDTVLFGTGAPSVRPLEVAARWLGLVSVLTLVGGALFSLVVLRRVARWLPPGLRLETSPSRHRTVWLSATGAFALSQLISAAAQAESVADLSFPKAMDPIVLKAVFFGSRFAALWWTRLILGVALGLLVALRSQRTDRGSREIVAWWQIGLGALLVVATSLGSHAVAARTLIPLAVAMDALHLSAAALWLGGLLHLTLFLPRTELIRPLVPAASRAFLWSVLVLVGTGVFNTWVEAGNPKALLITAYGQSLLVKLGLLLALCVIAAINRLHVVPRLRAEPAEGEAGAPGYFHALVRAELLLGAALLVAVALLGALPPPGQQALPKGLEVERDAGDLRVGVSVDPVWVGVSRFRVTLTDSRGLPPTDVRHVILTFTMEGMNMGRTNVTMKPTHEGVYEAEGFYVGMPGISLIGVGVTRSASADQHAAFRIEVPDLTQKQFAGLRASLGVGPLTLVSLGIGLSLAMAGAASRRSLTGRAARLAVTGLPLVLLILGGLILVDQRAAREGGDNPVPADTLSRGRGRNVYQLNCTPCHGERGGGDGPAAPSLRPPPADLTLHARWHGDEQLSWFISHGVPGSAMIGFADRLATREVWDVVNYMRDLAAPPTATLSRPTAVAKAPAASLPAPSPPAKSEPSVVTPTEPSAAEPAGRLVFGPDYDNNLWVLRLPDGRPEPITKLDPSEFSSNPVWSPDGRRIAFSYYKLPSAGNIPVPDGTDLYLSAADGSGGRLLAAHDAPGVALQYPAWTPDGSAIYVSYFGGGGLRASVDRVDVKSGARSQVVKNAGYPSVSPRGRRLSYVVFATTEVRGESLWWSAPDGSAPRQILGPNVFDKYFGVRFAPDGQRLLFAAVGQGNFSQPPATSRLRPLEILSAILAPRVAHANGDLWELWTVDLDGRNVRRLTALSEDMPVGAWSPDGKHVAFLGGGSAVSAEAGLAIIDAEGRQLRRLTTQPGHRGVDWTRPPRERSAPSTGQDR